MPFSTAWSMPAEKSFFTLRVVASSSESLVRRNSRASPGMAAEKTATRHRGSETTRAEPHSTLISQLARSICQASFVGPTATASAARNRKAFSRRASEPEGLRAFESHGLLGGATSHHDWLGGQWSGAQGAMMRRWARQRVDPQFGPSLRAQGPRYQT